MNCAIKEICQGIALWILGVVGIIFTLMYVTKHALYLYILFGSFFAMGVVLILVGVFDYLVDDFEEEVKKSYWVE